MSWNPNWAFSLFCICLSGNFLLFFLFEKIRRIYLYISIDIFMPIYWSWRLPMKTLQQIISINCSLLIFSLKNNSIVIDKILSFLLMTNQNLLQINYITNKIILKLKRNEMTFWTGTRGSTLLVRSIWKIWRSPG